MDYGGKHKNTHPSGGNNIIKQSKLDAGKSKNNTSVISERAIPRHIPVPLTGRLPLHVNYPTACKLTLCAAMLLLHRPTPGVTTKFRLQSLEGTIIYKRGLRGQQLLHTGQLHAKSGGAMASPSLSLFAHPARAATAVLGHQQEGVWGSWGCAPCGPASRCPKLPLAAPMPAMYLP